MQLQAVRSRHEDAREALAEAGACSGFRRRALATKEHGRGRVPFARRSFLRVAGARQLPACAPQRFGPIADPNQSVAAGFTLSKSASTLDLGSKLWVSFFCVPLTSALIDWSVGFSTRRDDPSNREFSSIDNDR